jgi:hypothetical protein
MARRPGNACDDRRREAGTSICYLTDSCVANSRRRIGGCGPAISGCRTDGPLRDDGVFQTGGRREERKRARRRHRLTGLLRAGLPVGPRGFEPRTCGLRVWCEAPGQRAARPMSWAFASHSYPSFLVVFPFLHGDKTGRHVRRVVICGACQGIFSNVTDPTLLGGRARRSRMHEPGVRWSIVGRIERVASGDLGGVLRDVCRRGSRL